MEKTKIIEALRDEVKKSEEFRETLQLFSKRRRDRNELTLGALAASLPTIPRQTLAEVLEKLSALGIGKLVLTKKGEIEALIHVHDTLQSIGQVALGRSDQLEPSKIKPLSTTSASSRLQRPVKQSNVAHVSVHRPNTKLVISLQLGGRLINIPVPEDMTAGEVGRLVAQLKQVKE